MVQCGLTDHTVDLITRLLNICMTGCNQLSHGLQICRLLMKPSHNAWQLALI